MAAYNFEIIRNAGRPSRYEESLKAWATDIIIWVQNYMLQNNRIATAESISSFKMIIEDNQILVDCAESALHALYGRKAGAMPPWREGSDLETWVIAKPITPYPDPLTGYTPSLSQITYLIARKIAREGTNPPKLVQQNLTAVINSKGVKYLEQIGEIQAQTISQQISDTFKRVGKTK